MDCVCTCLMKVRACTLSVFLKFEKLGFFYHQSDNDISWRAHLDCFTICHCRRFLLLPPMFNAASFQWYVASMYLRDCCVFVCPAHFKDLMSDCLCFNSLRMRIISIFQIMRFQYSFSFCFRHVVKSSNCFIITSFYQMDHST